MENPISTVSKWLNIEEAHTEFGFSKSWLYKKTADRTIPHYKPSGRIYFLKDELDQWIKNSVICLAESISN